MSSKVRFYLLVIHPQVSHSMDMGMAKDPTVFVSDFVYNIFRLDATKNSFGPSRTTLYTLCKLDQLFVFNSAADTIPKFCTESLSQLNVLAC
jgi:hypothetical protein